MIRKDESHVVIVLKKKSNLFKHTFMIFIWI